QNALLCAEELREDYPDRRVVCADTFCASAGMGFLVREALLRQQGGMELDALSAWLGEHCRNVAHWFTVDTFEHLRHGGRVSAASAAIGTMLQIKPLLTVDREGKLKVAGKPRGRVAAIKTLVSRMETEWMPEAGRLVGIAHGDCPDGAEQLKNAVLSRFPEADIRITEIGPVIGSHTGPGMLALLYWGSGR
ncbi:MAG: DegV family protein, partial [Oscillibacter sp.]|nr:DegV family protein [Oscillibacter sp.]